MELFVLLAIKPMQVQLLEPQLQLALPEPVLMEQPERDLDLKVPQVSFLQPLIQHFRLALPPP